jgi:predicted dehydrogenase
MSILNRREFLNHSKRTTLALAAGTVFLRDPRSVSATPANDKLIMAIVGCRGRGNMVAQGFARRDDCEMAYICDVDTSLFATRAKWMASCQGGKTPKCVQDFRKMLDDKAVDAVVIATPPHWHSLATIWCCQAGKDVYCEKPQSHSCWEGRKAVEAARKYNRVVQIGFQNRSAPYNFAAKKYIEEGKLGKIHLCRVFNQKGEPNFPMLPDSDPPAGFDWDMWNGPAPEHKYNATLREHWRHLWRYCGGDMTYDGIHQVDLARWLCGVKYPKTVYSSGNRYERDGGAESPDTQIATLDFDDLTMTFEMSLFTPYMLKADQGIRDGDMFPHWPQNTERIELYGTDGMMVVGRMGAGWQVFVRPKSRQPVVKDQMYGRFPDANHQADFVQAVRTRKTPNADIEEGHLSTLLVHYAMISYRLGGQKLTIDPKTEAIVGNAEARALFKREYRAPWVVPEHV